MTDKVTSKRLVRADAWTWMGQWKGSASTGNYVAAPGNWYRGEDYIALWEAYEEMKRCYEAWIAEAHRRQERIAALERAASAHETEPRQVTHRDEVMNPPASAAQGAEAGNLNTSQRHGTGAVPQGLEAQATQPAAAPSGSWVTPQQFAAEAAKRFARGWQIEQAIIKTFEHFGSGQNGTVKP